MTGLDAPPAHGMGKSACCKQPCTFVATCWPALLQLFVHAARVPGGGILTRAGFYTVLKRSDLNHKLFASVVMPIRFSLENCAQSVNKRPAVDGLMGKGKIPRAGSMYRAVILCTCAWMRRITIQPPCTAKEMLSSTPSCRVPPIALLARRTAL
jgi:hypothetical protein